MMNDADERTADSTLQPPIDHEERGMIQLILEKDIQSGGLNPCNEIAAEIVQEMSWIGAPGKREDLDVRAPFTERGDELPIVEIATRARLEASINDQSNTARHRLRRYVSGRSGSQKSEPERTDSKQDR